MKPNGFESTALLNEFEHTQALLRSILKSQRRFESTALTVKEFEYTQSVLCFQHDGGVKPMCSTSCTAHYLGGIHRVTYGPHVAAEPAAAALALRVHGLARAVTTVG